MARLPSSLLERVALRESWRKPINTYLVTNLALWRGFNACAQGYLLARERPPLPDSVDTVERAISHSGHAQAAV